MKSKRTSSSVIKGLLLALLLLCLCAGYALGGQAVGTVTHLSGPLLAKKSDGTTKILTRTSPVEEGDTLVTEKRTYARIKFNDASEVTLRPGTQFKVERFAYDEKAPKNDSAVMNLVKGGLRSVTGKIGKRGNQDAYEMKTPTATIGVRGTIYIAEFVPEEPAVSESNRVNLAALDAGHISGHPTMSDAPAGIAPAKTAPPLLLADNSGPGGIGGGGLSPGLYVQVLDGAISLSNKGGSQNFTAGQFGYSASIRQPPVVLPANPGIHFTPPPTFSSSAGPQGGSGGHSGSGSSKPVDCEVR
jgi:hypothetical protein